MSAVILLPDVPSGMTDVNIYVDDVLEDTISVVQREWQSNDTLVSAVIKVAFTDGGPETEQVIVKTFEQKLISYMRDVSNILEADISDVRIDAIFPFARDELMLDITMYSFEEELTFINDTYYKLPNKFFFDKNCGGLVTEYDIEMYSLEVPAYEYTEKVPLDIVEMNADRKYIKLSSKLAGTITALATFRYTGRALRENNLLLLLGSKITAMHYMEEYNRGTSIAGSGGTSLTGDIEIGDIQVKAVSVSGTTAVAATSAQLKDKWIQSNAKYNKLVQNFKNGFYRVR